MKRFSLIALLLMTSLSCIWAQRVDSLLKMAITYASQNNIEALRSINDEVGNKMPHHFHLFCDMSIARSEGNFSRVLECVDSLNQWYPKQIKKKTRISLAEIKAEALRKLGRYDELYMHCVSEIKRAQRAGFSDKSLHELYFFKEKADQLSGKGNQSLCLQLYDRQKIFELDTLYNKVKEELDELSRLRCEMLLSRAFHRPLQLSQTIKKLIEKYADQLDIEEITACVTEQADQFILEGKWKELEEWTKQIRETKLAHAAPLYRYEAWAKNFKEFSPTTILCPASPCTIPTTYEWPILIETTINSKKKAFFSIGTEHPFTLVSEKIAQQSGIEMLRDTVLLPTNNGLIAVCPAVVKHLSVGEILINDAFTYVVLHSNAIAAPFDCELGLNIWLTLGKISLQPEQFVIECADTAQSLPRDNEQNKSLYLSHNKGLYVLAYHQQHRHSLAVNASYPNNILYRRNWKDSASTFTQQLEIGGKMLTIKTPQFVDYKTTQGDGILGVPFLRHYRSVTLDFNKMQLTAEGETEYTPLRRKFGYDSDKHYLVRNYPSLTAYGTTDYEETLFLQLMIATGKNQPEKVANISHQLRDVKSEFYNLTTEAEALFQTGNYRLAAKLIEDKYKMSSHATTIDKKERTELEHLYKKCIAYSKEAAIIIGGKSDHATFLLEDGEEPTLRIHKKKAKAHLDILYPHTEISTKSVKKFKVKRLGTGEDYDYGIIPELYIGELQLQNVPCRILKEKSEIAKRIPHKGKGIHIGWDLLSHLQQITYSQQCITLSTTSTSVAEEGANLCLTDHWLVETYTNGIHRTYPLDKLNGHLSKEMTVGIAGKRIPVFISRSSLPSRADADGKYIDFFHLISTERSVTFDMGNMRLILK